MMPTCTGDVIQSLLSNSRPIMSRTQLSIMTSDPAFIASTNNTDPRTEHLKTDQHDKKYLKWQKKQSLGTRTIQVLLWVFSLAQLLPDIIWRRGLWPIVQPTIRGWLRFFSSCLEISHVIHLCIHSVTHNQISMGHPLDNVVKYV